MSYVQIFSAIRLYGLDVLLLAMGVTLTCSLLKKTVLKKCPKKLYVFLPFAVGLIFYAAYRALATLSAIPFTQELGKTVEGGFTCGCVATIYYVVYEQFIRKSKISPIYPLLEGFVPDKVRLQAAQTLWEEGKTKEKEELYAFIMQTLISYCQPPTEEELAPLCSLIEKFLLTFGKK